MGQINWFERKFDFSSVQNTMPSILERLEGTTVRLKEKLKKIDASRYRIKPDGKWSILEHVGHLADVEPLWQGRLDDLLSAKEELRPTDLDNRKTTEAGHNEKDPAELLRDFDLLRMVTVNKLQQLTEENIFRAALHPRLKTPMRTIDLFTFVAEHDDHHLAKISEIARKI